MAMVGQRGARNGFLSLTVSLLLAAEYAGFYAVFLLWIGCGSNKLGGDKQKARVALDRLKDHEARRWASVEEYPALRQRADRRKRRSGKTGRERVISHSFAGECTERGRPVKALRFAPTATRRKKCGL